MPKNKTTILISATVLLALQSLPSMAENGLIELRVKTHESANKRIQALDHDTTGSTQNRNLDLLMQNTDASSWPRWITVSLDQQSLKLYQGTEVINRSHVSSGKSGHETPTGIFSILGKRKYHESNIYSNAPMPYMQRLTWSGIALHESDSVPSYPASHGCIRLPNGFAKQLFGQTRHGIHVIITPEEVAPKWVSHPSLFQSNKSDINLAALRSSITSFTEQTDKLVKERQAKPKPLRIYITRTTKRDKVLYVQDQLFKLGYTYSEPDGLFGNMTIEAVRRFQSANSLKRTGTITQELLDVMEVQSGGLKVPLAKLFVRQDKKPIYETPLTLRDPSKPLGTHLLMSPESSNSDVKWLSVSISSKIPAFIINEHGLDKAIRNTRVYANIGETLDRIVIPEEARAFIEARLEGGASFAISDNGLGTETGDGTDFIVQTN